MLCDENWIDLVSASGTEINQSVWLMGILTGIYNRSQNIVEIKMALPKPIKIWQVCSWTFIPLWNLSCYQIPKVIECIRGDFGHLLCCNVGEHMRKNSSHIRGWGAL